MKIVGSHEDQILKTAPTIKWYLQGLSRCVCVCACVCMCVCVCVYVCVCVIFLMFPSKALHSNASIQVATK